MGLRSPGNCDRPTSEANRTTALNRNWNPQRHFAPVAVVVTASNAAQGTFSFKATRVDGTIFEYKDIPWADETKMWVCCPSSLPSTCNDPDDPTNASRPPAVGVRGDLFLEKSFTDAVTPEMRHGTPKWPGSAAGDGPYAEITVMPSSILFRGIELEDGQNKEGSVDLRDPAFADVHHALVLEPSGTKLRLSAKGFAAFGQPFPLAKTLEDDLTEAVAIIQAPPTDAAAMARAWAVVATAVATFRRDHGPAANLLLPLIKRVIPDF